MKKWSEKIADLSAKLDELSKKTADASASAKEAREKKREAIESELSNVKGEVVAFEERTKLAADEEKSKISSALLKAQMTWNAKKQDRKDNIDKAFLEFYMDDRAVTAVDCLEAANYLIANALVNFLELTEAAVEYEDRFGGEE